MDDEKRPERRYWLWALLGLFVLVAAVRLFLAFSQGPLAYDGYEMARRVEHVRHTGVPLFADALSFGGRARLFSPLYDYLLALFTLVMPTALVIKIVPNLLAATIVFPAFWLAEMPTERRWPALIAAAMAGLVPATLQVGVNDGSVLSLGLPLVFTSLLLFLRSRKSGKHLQWMLVSLVLLALLGPVSLVVLLVLLFYLFLARLVGKKATSKEVEVTLLYVFFSSWFFLVVYKRALVMHGASVVWQNIPAAALGGVFAEVSLLGVITSAGVVTLVAGAASLYAGLSVAKRKSLVLLASLVVVAAVLLWLRFLPLREGLALLAVALAVPSGFSLELLYGYMAKTKLSYLSWMSVTAVVFIFVMTSLPAALTQQAAVPSDAEFEVLEWAAKRLPENAVVMAPPVQGDLIAAVAQRRTVIDEDYLLIPRVEERYEDVLLLYRAVFTTDAVALMQKYGATHLLVSPQSASFSRIAAPRFMHEDEECFVLRKAAVDEDGVLVQLFELRCSLKGETHG